MPHDDTYRHECVDTLALMRANVAEHKDPDYLLAKAAFTVMHDLNPSLTDPAWIRAEKYQAEVYSRNWEQWTQAWNHVFNRKPRRRWQDNRPVTKCTDYGK